MRSRRTLPAVGMIEPTSMRANVDFPEPEAPTIASDSPGSSSKEMPLRITFFVGGGTYKIRPPVGLSCRRGGPQPFPVEWEISKKCRDPRVGGASLYEAPPTLDGAFD